MNQLISTLGFDSYRISQRAAIPLITYFHPIMVLQFDTVTKAKGVRTEEVDM